MEPTRCLQCGVTTINPCDDAVYGKNCVYNTPDRLLTKEARRIKGENIALLNGINVGSASVTTQSPPPPATNSPISSDGGATSYYDLPPGAVTLNDLIEHKQMSFARGNIFKACYRLGEKDSATEAYDLRKIIYFAERLLARVSK